MNTRDDLFNRGDTIYFLLDYQVNGEDMVEGAYQEIELQLNKQSNYFNVKKMLSKGEVYWVDDFTYIDDEDIEQTFTGYVAPLTQQETFMLRNGKTKIQLRVMLNGEVGSSKEKDLDVGDALSHEVLE